MLFTHRYDTNLKNTLCVVFYRNKAEKFAEDLLKLFSKCPQYKIGEN